MKFLTIDEHLTIDNVYTATETRKNFSSVCDQACENHENILIKRTGANKQDVVVMSAEDFRGLQETLYLLASPKNAKRLQQAMDYIESGKPLLSDPRKR